MKFPFTVRFNRSLKTVITADNKEQVLQYITDRILEDKANNIVPEDMAVSYKGSTSNWRGSLFGSVDNGVFYLIYKNDRWSLNYEINMRKLFVGALVMSIVMGAFASTNGSPWWVGIAAFLWLCGVNWIIIVIRHGSLATDIAAGVDELIYGKTEQPPEQDKMTGELKSWF